MLNPEKAELVANCSPARLYETRQSHGHKAVIEERFATGQ